MGAAYFIVIDNPDPGFDTFVDGKALTREMDTVSEIAKKLTLTDIHDFASFAGLAEEFDLDVEMPAASEKWLEPSDGVTWVKMIRQYIASNPDALVNVVAVDNDLKAWERVLGQAAAIHAKWHLEIDF